MNVFSNVRNLFLILYIAQWRIVREADATLQLCHVYASHDHLYHEVCELMA